MGNPLVHDSPPPPRGSCPDSDDKAQAQGPQTQGSRPQAQGPQAQGPHGGARLGGGEAETESSWEAARNRAEGEAWARAAVAHERSGRRAFSGGGYQDQHFQVAHAMKRWDRMHPRPSASWGGFLPSWGGVWAAVRGAVFS